MIDLKVIWFFICIDFCVRIKSNFVHILINIRAKVHLNG